MVRGMGMSAAAAMLVIGLAATPASAKDCKYIAAAGNGPTEGIATIMSNGGLKTLIDAKGMTPQGLVKTKCKPGALFTTECTSWQMACK